MQVPPGEGVDDPGNNWDSWPTMLAMFEHNARYHAACHDEEAE